MKYQGGKGRIAKQLVHAITAQAPNHTTWVEPFVGGAWMLDAAHASGQFASLYAGDARPDVIALYEAVAAGWQPPAHISRDQWQQLRTAEPSPLRALAGFGSSYGGVWFCSYCGDKPNGRHTNSELAAAHLIRRRPVFAATDLRAGDYRQWTDLIDGTCVVYCDPPYAGTRHDSYARGFDPGQFWAWCEAIAGRGAAVFVSEYTAPPVAVEVWSQTRRQTVARVANKPVTERLFHVPT